MTPLSWSVGTGTVLGTAAYLAYEHYLHPAWRRQRRITQACEKAFHEEDYRLVRIRLHPNGPSGMDLFSSSPSGSSISRRYFTYRIENTGGNPDLSGLKRKEISLIRHYLDRSEKSPHYGETVLHPEHKSVSPLGRTEQEAR
jgi:hypothetical protein